MQMKQNFKHIMGVAALAGTVLFTSCKKDEKEVVTLEQRKTEFSQAADNMTANIKALAETDAFTALTGFFHLANEGGFDGGKAHLDLGQSLTKAFSHEAREAKKQAKQQAQRLKKSFLPEKLKTKRDGGFEFDEQRGIYNWVDSLKELIQVGQSDIIIVNFPADENRPYVLNAKLSLTAYQDIEVSYDYGHDHLPTLLQANLQVDGKEAARVDFKASYDNEGVPSAMATVLSMDDFKYVGNMTYSNRVFKTTSALTKGNETLVAQDVKVAFKDENGEYPISAEGFVQYGPIKIQGGADIEALDKIDQEREVTIADLNKHINMGVYSAADNEKIGTIQARQNGDEFAAVVVFTDGTEQDLEEYLAPIIQEIESILNGLG
jgi:lipopolysaccharide export system protein LptA